MNTQTIKARFTAIINDALYAAAQTGASGVQDMLNNGTRWVSSEPGQMPAHQTGALTKSITAVHPDTLGTPFHAAFGTNKKHGRWMQYGVTIRPKTGKALPIPCNIAAKQMLYKLNPSGEDGKGISLRTQKLVPFIKDGKRYLAEATPTGKIKKNGALFVLRKSATILPRPWLDVGARRARIAISAAFRYQVERGIKAVTA